jgi:prephenate dehydrogenase
MAESIQSVAIFGTGLIGASVGLALRAQGFLGSIVGYDRSPSEAEIARSLGAIDAIAENPLAAAKQSDCIVLATPVFGILDWVDRLAPVLRDSQLVTDVGSTKQAICERAVLAFPSSAGAHFLPGHPMAGKEVHGAVHADANLFRGAVWLFTQTGVSGELGVGKQRAAEWRQWVQCFGSRTLDLDPKRHDEICAWASHLPQMLGTALAALLEDIFPEPASSDAGNVAAKNLDNSASQLQAIGGRAMHEMTRLGASPFSMWRDIAQTNEEAIAAALLALEQRLALIRENLKEPELRDQFQRANRFRSRF